MRCRGSRSTALLRHTSMHEGDFISQDNSASRTVKAQWFSAGALLACVCQEKDFRPSRALYRDHIRH